MKLELDARLRAFAAYVRQGSFSRAADELAVSQPAVSRHISDLEERLKLPLVDRGARSGRLTAGGRYLADAVLRAQSLLAQAERGIEAFRAEGSALLTIAASGTPGTYLIPPVISEFHRLHPNIELQVLMGTSAEAVEVVRTHKAEIGVVGGFVAGMEIEAVPLMDDEIVVVSAPGPTTPAEVRALLAAATWVSREEGSATRAAIEAAWDDQGIVPSTRLEMPSWEAVKLVVARGGAVAACSRVALEVELLAGTLAILDVPGWNVRRTISVIFAREAPLTPPARQFFDMMVSHSSKYQEDAHEVTRTLAPQA